MELPRDHKKWIDNFLENHHINLKSSDFSRPWGGFYVIDESSLSNFVEVFFPELLGKMRPNQPWSPKVLFVAPEQKLSWQYHLRRSEVWRIIKGKVGVVRSSNDKEGPLKELNEDAKIELFQGERHRLIGADEWGVVAEIWQHSNPDNLSDENDIIRVQDDFGR